MTWPLVILGALGINVSSFSSRIQVATTLEDSLPCSAVLKKTKRAEDAVAGFDQVVAPEAGQQRLTSAASATCRLRLPTLRETALRSRSHPPSGGRLRSVAARRRRVN